LILIALICITSRHICAQEQNNNWVFGSSARVNFGGPVPNGSFFSSINSNEQCASVSDPVTGNLLFFTDGVSVWRGNNSLMPNGNNLMGGAYLSASQGALIVPFPENNQKYFIFTLDEMEYDVPPVYNGLRYTVVDMSLDGGAGDVDVNNNLYIGGNFTIGNIHMVATKPNNSNSWFSLGSALLNGYVLDLKVDSDNNVVMVAPDCLHLD
jgi:hypothetical protein